MSTPAAEAWLVLNSGPCASAFNMALDEALMIMAPALGRPVLRFYGWQEAAATFGYFQKIAEIEAITRLRPLLRRPTGGGLVPHDADWTYSVAVPPSHPWYDLRAPESYARMHEWIQRAFARLGAPTALAPAARKDLPGQCFVGYEKSDVLQGGRKIAGAAQRRTRSGLLIQGSIQPQPRGIARAVWEAAMLADAAETWQAHWEVLNPAPELLAKADWLSAEKYAQDKHNRMR